MGESTNVYVELLTMKSTQIYNFDGYRPSLYGQQFNLGQGNINVNNMNIGYKKCNFFAKPYQDYSILPLFICVFEPVNFWNETDVMQLNIFVENLRVS